MQPVTPYLPIDPLPGIYDYSYEQQKKYQDDFQEELYQTGPHIYLVLRYDSVPLGPSVYATFNDAKKFAELWLTQDSSDPIEKQKPHVTTQDSDDHWTVSTYHELEVCYIVRLSVRS
jgi:hypothetical protein